MYHEQYTAKDFVMDESFQRWVLQPDPELNEFWELWLFKNPHKAAEVDEARHILSSLVFQPEEVTLEQRHRILHQILQQVAPVADTSSPQRNHLLRAGRFITGWYRVAAAVAILLAASALIWFNLNRRVEYETTYGETQTIILPDQSTVVLNANSSLTFRKDWQNTPNREVWLDGEAFFSVRKKKNQRQPVKFTVHSGEVRVEVLGTQFTVSKRPATTQVILNEGKIKLHLPAHTGLQNLVMKPGELIEYQTDLRQVTRRRVNAEIYSSWIRHQWMLENTSLQQVADRIEATYGVKVKIADPRLAGELMTGVLPTANLDKLLQVLSATYGIKIRQENNQIILTQ